MLDIKQIVFDLLSTVLATIIGLVVFRKLDRFYRLLLLQAIIYLVIDSIASALSIMPGNKYNNSWLYNIEILFETAVLFAAAQAYFNSNLSKQVLLIVFSFFLLVFCTDVFYLSSFSNFAFHAAIAEGLLMTVLYIIIMYFQFMKKADTFITAPVILASIGMILYFAASIPYLSVIFYLQKVNAGLNRELFQNIVVVLADVRYLFIAIAFFIAGRTSAAANTNKTTLT